MSQVVIINNLEELEGVLAQTDGKHIIKISNKSCIPCRAINPFYEEFSEEFLAVTFYSIVADQVEDEHAIGVKLRSIRVSTVPTFIILDDGVETRVSGAFSKTKLKEALNLV